MEPEVILGRQAEADLTNTFQPPSRGPPPVHGQYALFREDGLNWVYLMELCGPLDRLYPGLATSHIALIKIGRGNDPMRRCRELNEGFPPSLGLRWTVVRDWECPSASIAHDEEQALLTRLKTERLTIGREFAFSPRSRLHEWGPSTSDHSGG